MKHTTGFYPRVRVDSADKGVVSQAGGSLLTEVVRVSGLDRFLAAGLTPWRKPRAIHDPAKVVTDLAVALGFGWRLPGRYRAAARRVGDIWAGGLGADGFAHDRCVGQRRTRGVDGDQHRPGGGTRPSVGVSRPARRARRNRRCCSAGDRRGRHPGHGALGQGVRCGHLQARLWVSSVVGLCRPRK